MPTASALRILFAQQHGYPSRTKRALLYLCAAGLLALSCGDFTLNLGNAQQGSGTTPGPIQEDCDKPFEGLSKYDAKNDESNIDGTTSTNWLADAVAVAVVPKGMTFTFSDAVTGTKVTAAPGDLVVADTDSDKIYFYDKSAGNARHTLIYNATKFAEPGGVDLYHEQISTGTPVLDVNLLVYTGKNLENNKYTLYIKDLTTGTSYTVSETTNPAYKFTNPTAVAVGASSQNRGVFVVDDSGNKVVRVTFTFSGTALPTLNTPKKILDGDDIQDVVFYNQNQTLYFSDWGPGGNYQVYQSGSALTVDNPGKSVFITKAHLFQPMGLALAFTVQDASGAKLLVISRQVSIAIQQFAVTGGGTPESGVLEILQPENLHAVAYDCTHARILFTRTRGPNATTEWGVYEVYQK